VTLRRRAARVLLLAVALQVVFAALPIARPTRLTWAAVDRWYLDVGPALAAMSLLRLAAQVATGWIVLASTLQLVAAGGGRPHLATLADRVAPRFLRSVACGAASLSLSAGLAPTASPIGGGPPPGTAVMVPLDAVVTTTTSTSTSTTTADDAVRPTTTTTTVAPRPDAVPAPVTPGPADPPPHAPRPDEVLVRPGDSFWSIAEDHADRTDVAAYWRDLIAANRDRLVDRSNPDLLYPAQVLRLP
jgi:hypothetical protein